MSPPLPGVPCVAFGGFLGKLLKPGSTFGSVLGKSGVGPVVDGIYVGSATPWNVTFVAGVVGAAAGVGAPGAATVVARTAVGAVAAVAPTVGVGPTGAPGAAVGPPLLGAARSEEHTSE